MYEFVDIPATSAAGTVSMPAEAMRYDGKYLENEVPGYRTLWVEGRELMESEALTKSIDGMDGETWYGSSLPARTITVGYLLKAETNAAFRAAFNKMNRLLSGKQVQIIFADEPDKYFIGTKTGNTQPEHGTNICTGEITILCTDPLKYATTETPFPFSNGTATIVNNGSVSVPIRYEITHNHENGYIGIASEHGAMEFGKREEADKEYVKNQQLLSIQNFISAPNDTTGTDYMHPTYGVSGTMATHTYTFPSGYSGTYLGFGSAGTLKGPCSGGLRTLEVPADTTGVKGAKNWYCYMHLAQWAGAMGQTGELTISFLTSDNKVIAGLTWYKTDCSGNTGHYQIVGPNGVIRTWGYETHHLQERNPFTDSWGHCDLRKEGSKLTFFYWGAYFSYDIPEAADMTCAKIQVSCKQYGSRGGDQMISTLGFDIIDFYKSGVSAWRDVPNRYASGSTVTIDGDTGKFLVSGMPKPEDEIIGTQWFKAHPGDTEIKLCVSSFCSPAPTAKAYIREAWV